MAALFPAHAWPISMRPSKFGLLPFARSTFLPHGPASQPIILQVTSSRLLARQPMPKLVAPKPFAFSHAEPTDPAPDDSCSPIQNSQAPDRPAHGHHVLASPRELQSNTCYLVTSSTWKPLVASSRFANRTSPLAHPSSLVTFLSSRNLFRKSRQRLALAHPTHDPQLNLKHLPF